MIHIIKNNKWVITTSLVCILSGILTFFTFVNQSFIQLNDFNLQILLLLDLVLLLLFFTVIISKTYRILKERKKRTLGSETSLRYLIFFSTTTLLPSVLIAVFSLILFNVGIQQYFDKKIKSVVNNSAEIAKNYVEQTKSSVETDILLMFLDVNKKVTLGDSSKLTGNLKASTLTIEEGAKFEGVCNMANNAQSVNNKK